MKKKIKNSSPKVILFFLLILISCFCLEIGNISSLVLGILNITLTFYLNIYIIFVGFPTITINEIRNKH